MADFVLKEKGTGCKRGQQSLQPIQKGLFSGEKKRQAEKIYIVHSASKAQGSRRAVCRWPRGLSGYVQSLVGTEQSHNEPWRWGFCFSLDTQTPGTELCSMLCAAAHAKDFQSDQPVNSSWLIGRAQRRRTQQASGLGVNGPEKMIYSVIHSGFHHAESPASPLYPSLLSHTQRLWTEGPDLPFILGTAS